MSRQSADLTELFRLGGEFFLIAGPCVLEDDRLNIRVAETLARFGEEFRVPVIFKSSFDKANRSTATSPRGPGLEAGLQKLRRVREETGLPVLTDVHESVHCAQVAEVVDVLQIPAFLCRQTDLLTAAGATGRPVNVKKGQWMAPEEMGGAANKLRSAGAPGVSVTERGTFLGYGNLVVDMRSFEVMREACDAPVVFDGTHSVQRPGMGGGVSGGEPRFIPTLVRAAAAAGIDALFLEVHPNPSEAPSDATSMLRLDRFSSLLEEVLAIREAVTSPRARSGA